MTPMTLGELAAAIGGALDGADPDLEVAGPVVADSRAAEPGAIFVCVVGERTDGHDHVAQAMSRGAVVALAARPVAGPAVIVADPVVALGRLAAYQLSRLPDCTVVGVTGSAGKTSTKDMIAGLLARLGPTVAPAGSYNTEVGLPLTVLRADARTRYLVLEYGARGIGHIAMLTETARPEIAVELNVGSAHLGEFGSPEAIAQAKSELVAALPATGTAVLWVDDSRVAAMADRTAASVVRVGSGAASDLRVGTLTLDDNACASFTLEWRSSLSRVSLGVPGGHQVGNAAAAAAVALTLGMSLADVAAGLDEHRALSPHRMAVLTRADGLRVIDDAYNANPESMAAALRALRVLGGDESGQTWAVLGEMRELGSVGPAAHRTVGRLAAELGIDHLLAVGAGAAEIAAGASCGPTPVADVTTVADGEAATERLLGAVGPADCVLVKASNAVALWGVAEDLASAVPAGSPR